MEWSVGAYIGSASKEDDLHETLDVHLWRMASLYARYAPEFVAQRKAVNAGEIGNCPCRALMSHARLANAGKSPSEDGPNGPAFDICCGRKELHSCEGTGPVELWLFRQPKTAAALMGGRIFPTPWIRALSRLRNQAALARSLSSWNRARPTIIAWFFCPRARPKPCGTGVDCGNTPRRAVAVQFWSKTDAHMECKIRASVVRCLGILGCGED